MGLCCLNEKGTITVQLRENTRAFIQAIHNAPSLEELYLDYAAIKISDIKDLHARATKLKRLEFEEVEIDDNDLEAEN